MSMTNEEKLQAKAQVLAARIAGLRHLARHNGAAVSADAGMDEVIRHAADMDAGKVPLLWQDINTIDRIKALLRNFPDTQAIVHHDVPIWGARPEGLTTKELMTRPINDPTLVPSEYPPDGWRARNDWAVVKITHEGTQLLSYGGGYYQAYKQELVYPEGAEESFFAPSGTTYKWVQKGDTELLKTLLDAEDAPWHAQTFTASLDGSQDVYSEGGEDFYVLPCEDLPSDIQQLLSLRITRAADAAPLAYTLSEWSCSMDNEGMIDLPHGIYLIYDNSTLESAPRGLLVPKALVDGSDTVIPWTGLEISYNARASGLERLRLVSDFFGEEYIISTQDDTLFTSPWEEDLNLELMKDHYTMTDIAQLRRVYLQLKEAMTEAGFDVSTAYLKDMTGLLADRVPAEMEELAAELKADPETLDTLREAFSSAAAAGAMFNAIITPTEKVKEEDLNA